jgi:glycosyltransferase involved in cell wall biosynthesis
MRALVVSCVFPPEPSVSAQTSAQVAEELVKRGHHVTVVTAFPSRPSGRLYPGYARKLFQRERTAAGFELIRCFSILSPESRVLSRLLENVSFGLSSGLAMLRVGHRDVIYANTWPIVASGIAVLIARVRKTPVVVSIQDVYPESMISQRRIGPDGAMARLMRWADALVARACKEVIVISEAFASIYRADRGVAPDRLHVVPNWVDGDSIHPNDNCAVKLRERYGIPSSAFVVVYGGNIGAAAYVETVVECFRHLKHESNLYLLVAGEGSNLAACQTLARDFGGERILFHTPWLLEETSAVLGAADLLILPTRDLQSRASVPSKVISYMLAARPIIALALSGTELANLIVQSGCGWVIEPESPVELALKLEQIAALPAADRMRLGEAGRSFALKTLTRDVCLPKVIDILESAAGGKQG